MRSVFDQHTERADNGIVTGGEGELYCLYKVELGERTVRKLVKTPCRYIIEDLCDLFHDFYHFDETVLDLSEDPTPTPHRPMKTNGSELSKSEKPPRSLARPNGYWR